MLIVNKFKWLMKRGIEWTAEIAPLGEIILE